MFAKLRIRTALVFGLILSVPAMASAATVALAWNANPEGNIAGYILVYGTTPGSYSSSVDVGSTTAHSISSLTAGTRYYFAVRAYNTSGVSGPLSGEVNEVPTDAPPPPPPPAVELVAAYGFGEASGSSALDKTTNNNDGTLAAGVTRTAAGRFGNAVVFNGVDGIVTIPSTASLDMTSAFTLEAWVNPSAAGGWRTVVMKQSSGGHTYVLYSDTGSSGPSGHVQTSSDRTATTPAPLALNTWAHVAAVSDGTTLRVLVNGQQTASVSVLAGVVSSTAPLGIGGNLVWGEYFAGTIDEVRIYRGALTDAQVQQDMITAVEPTGPDTTAPTVSVTSPASGSAVAGSVNITATAADNVAVAGVRFAVDGVNSGSEDVTAPYALSWNTTTVPNGSHTLTAIARDSSGNLKTSAAVTVTVANGDTTNPTVSITSPVNGASVTGSISITATAADAVAVSGVRFLLDGVSLGTEDLTAPYAQAWNSTTTTNGSHALTAIARDSSGNVKTSATVTVTITNDTGQPSVTSVSPANGASGVAQSAFVTATFSEPMAPASISSSTFELRNAAGALRDGGRHIRSIVADRQADAVRGADHGRDVHRHGQGWRRRRDRRGGQSRGDAYRMVVLRSGADLGRSRGRVWVRRRHGLDRERRVGQPARRHDPRRDVAGRTLRECAGVQRRRQLAHRRGPQRDRLHHLADDRSLGQSDVDQRMARGTPQGSAGRPLLRALRQ